MGTLDTRGGVCDKTLLFLSMRVRGRVIRSLSAGKGVNLLILVVFCITVVCCYVQRGGCVLLIFPTSVVLFNVDSIVARTGPVPTS